MTSTDALDRVLRDATRVRVTAGDEVLLDADVGGGPGNLRAALAVDEVTDVRCMCWGDLAFAFAGADGRRIAVVRFHHAVTLRWSGWDGDAVLRDGTAPLRWLAGRGVTGPLDRETERRRRRAAEERTGAAAAERWLAAAPPAVRDLCGRVMADGSGGAAVGAADQLSDRMSEAFPDPVERAAATLAWYGSGTGRYSGFPSYEAFPEPLLAATPVAVLIAALEAAPDDDAVAAGAVRHLCGWPGRADHDRDVRRLPAGLRTRLLAVARASGDGTFARRAERWFTT